MFFSYDLDVKVCVHVDMSIREHVNRLVLLRRDMYEGDVDPIEDFLGETFVWLPERVYEASNNGPARLATQVENNTSINRK